MLEEAHRTYPAPAAVDQEHVFPAKRRGPHRAQGAEHAHLCVRALTARRSVTRTQTSNFTLHHFETASGLRFVLNTDHETGDLRSNLRNIYR